MSVATLAPWLPILHLACTLYMVGLIWFVQRVHYPLFAAVGPSRFADYEQAHVARTGPVVGPAMLGEAGLAVLLVALPGAAPPPLAWLGAGLLVVVWLSTALLQVPSHGVLREGFDPGAHRRLVLGNWIRTIAWSARGLVALAIAAP